MFDRIWQPSGWCSEVHRLKHWNTKQYQQFCGRQKENMNIRVSLLIPRGGYAVPGNSDNKIPILSWIFTARISSQKMYISAICTVITRIKKEVMLYEAMYVWSFIPLSVSCGWQWQWQWKMFYLTINTCMYITYYILENVNINRSEDYY